MRWDAKSSSMQCYIGILKFKVCGNGSFLMNESGAAVMKGINQGSMVLSHDPVCQIRHLTKVLVLFDLIISRKCLFQEIKGKMIHVDQAVKPGADGGGRGRGGFRGRGGGDFRGGFRGGRGGKMSNGILSKKLSSGDLIISICQGK